MKESYHQQASSRRATRTGTIDLPCELTRRVTCILASSKSDGPLSRLACERFVRQLREGEGRAYSFVVRDASEVLDPELFFQVLGQPSLMGTSVIVLYDVHKAGAGLKVALERLIRKPEFSAFLVFNLAGEEDGGLLDALRVAASAGLAEVCVLANGRQLLKRWIVDFFSTRGLRVEKEALSLLVEFIFQDPLSFESELAKLHHFCVDKGVVAARDVAEICVPSEQATVYDYLEALIQGDAARAIAMLDRVLGGRGISVELFLAALMNEVRRMGLVKELVAQGAKEKDIERRIGVGGFRLKMTCQRACRTSESWISWAISQVAELELRNRSKSKDIGWALRLFTTRAVERA